MDRNPSLLMSMVREFVFPLLSYSCVKTSTCKLHIDGVCVSGNVYTGTVDGKLWRIGPDDSLTFITHMGQNLPECGWCLFRDD